MSTKKKKPINAAKLANEFDRKIQSMKDKPVHKISTTNNNSATNLIGYYHTDTPKKDTKMGFRISAAKK